MPQMYTTVCRMRGSMNSRSAYDSQYQGSSQKKVKERWWF